METLYSILSVQIRPEVQERITIGFLLIGEGKIIFDFSKNKLSTAKELLSENSFRLLKDSLKNIEITANNEFIESGKSKNQLALSEKMLRTTFSNEYLHYLSRYNNNVLTFSAPKRIDLNCSQELFDSLFRKFVDDNDWFSSPKKLQTIDEFKSLNKETLIKHFNIEQKLTSKEIPKLIAPIKVDLVGKNELPVFVQSIDLEKSVYHIQNDLSQIFFLHDAYENKKSKIFVISQEPDKREVQQHEIWKNLRGKHFFEYVEIKETNKVLEYAKKHNVSPLLSRDK